MKNYIKRIIEFMKTPAELGFIAAVLAYPLVLLFEKADSTNMPLFVSVFAGYALFLVGVLVNLIQSRDV